MVLGSCVFFLASGYSVSWHSSSLLPPAVKPTSSLPVVPLPEAGKGVRAAGGAGAGPESDTLWCQDSPGTLGILS